MKTIIHISEPSLDPQIAEMCRKQLKKACGDNHIISVSQVPLDLGENICVGDIGRSWLNIYKQQLVGLKATKTEYVAIAEHDVLYTQEHFDWTPPRNDTFYYNENNWFVEWRREEMRGMYSRWPKPRLALSQLICSRDLLIQSIEERLQLIEGGIKIMRKLGEPGAFPPKVVEAARIAVSGKPHQMQHLLEDHLTKFKYETFKTVLPNLDIRHESNFTGARRGKNRTYELFPWGRFSMEMV